MNEPSLMLEMLRGKTIAVVGLSDNPGKASHGVSLAMQQAGYRIFPVNPLVQTVLGETSYASLADLPERPDIVNVFRLPRAIPGIVDEMIGLDLKHLWVQMGITHLESAERAESAGIGVVMDRCIMVEHARLRSVL
jgi:uncharacterized protein